MVVVRETRGCREGNERLLAVLRARGGFLAASPPQAVCVRCVTPPSREVTRGEAVNEARRPPGVGHRRPLRAPRDPPEGGEWGSQP